jgi:hypothetical protein
VIQRILDESHADAGSFLVQPGPARVPPNPGSTLASRSANWSGGSAGATDEETFRTTMPYGSTRGPAADTGQSARHESFTDAGAKEGVAARLSEHVQRRPRPSSAPHSRPSGTARKASISSDASSRRYRCSREELERQAREKLERECTFKPKTSRAPVTYASKRREHLSKLAQSSSGAWQKRKQQREQSADAELQECTFQPKITAKKTHSEKDSTDSCAGSRVADRLHHEADSRIASRQQLK